MAILLSNHICHAAVITGDFIYAQENSHKVVEYHVSKADFQGIPAWRIAWQCEQLRAEHFLRRDNGMPLYVKRINSLLQRSIEITYSQDAKYPSIYRKQAKHQSIERKIWQQNLYDLGVLPQLLLPFAQHQHDEDIHFSAINYDDGKVYALLATRSGFRKINMAGQHIRCAIYDIQLDSWLSNFVRKTRLLIPSQQQASNFMTYHGPSLDGSSDLWSLKLIHQSHTVAINKEP